jgi:hypothetical protein
VVKFADRAETFEQPPLIKQPKTVMAQRTSFSSLDIVSQYPEGRHKKHLFCNELFENEESISTAVGVLNSGSAVYSQ